MSDFTLEELKELLYYTDHYMSCKWSSLLGVQLEMKLKDMIEERCDCELD